MHLRRTIECRDILADRSCGRAHDTFSSPRLILAKGSEPPFSERGQGPTVPVSGACARLRGVVCLCLWAEVRQLAGHAMIASAPMRQSRAYMSARLSSVEKCIGASAPIGEKGTSDMSRAQQREASAKPRAITVIVGQLGAGGSERQLYLFLAHCDRSLWDPVVYVSGELGLWADEIRKLGIPVVLLTGNPIVKLLQFRSAVVAQGATCFFSWSSYTNPFGLALAGLPIRRIGSFRNAVFADLPVRGRWLWSRMSLAGVSSIVCNSSRTLRGLSGYIGTSKSVAFVPNAVQMLAPHRILASRAHWRARLGIADDTVLILGVGRLAPQKRFARFVEVIAEVRRQRPVQAVVAGEDQGCLAELREQVRQLGLENALRFVGEVPDARELMCAADVFLLTSAHEGMPNVVLEAMAAGVPCVATNVNGIDDLIEPGRTGFVSDEVADLARHVLALAAEPKMRDAMGSRSRSVVEQRFSHDRVVHRLWALCEP